MTQTNRARAYLAKMPPAISGGGGHAATLNAACRLVEFGVDEGEAFEILCAWNQTHCHPPWSERELRHKLADASRRTSPKREFYDTNSAKGCDGRGRLVPTPITQQPARRPMLPAMYRGTSEQIAKLARLRGLSTEGVALASQRGLVRFGSFRGKAAWFVTDQTRRAAQGRRLDGLPWAEGVKAWTLSGSQAKWPVGVREAISGGGQRHSTIVMCEGGPDLLAAFHFLVAEGRAADCAPVAMLGAGCSIHPDALPMFTGKRVRIFPHLDETGQAGAARWTAQLAEVGATVDAFSFASLRRKDGGSVKDLNDLAVIHPDDFEQHRCLMSLFPCNP